LAILKDKTVIVTGAAGSLGLATAGLFLASDQSSFTTGSVLSADGGMHV